MLLILAAAMALNTLPTAAAWADAAHGDRIAEAEVASREPGRRPLRDLGRAVEIFVDDGLHVYSSPARLDRRGLLKASAFVGAGLLLFAFDEPIYDALKDIESKSFYRPIAKLGENAEPLGYMGNTNIYYFGGLALGYLLGIDSLTRLSAQILESHGIAGIGKNLAGVAVGRSRPFEERGPYHFQWNGGTSFPSGHASVIFQDATIIAHHLPWWPLQVAVYTVAGAVTLQRVTSDNHWPADAYAGALFGAAVARALMDRHEERKLALIPLISADGLGLALKARF